MDSLYSAAPSGEIDSAPTGGGENVPTVCPILIPNEYGDQEPCGWHVVNGLCDSPYHAAAVTTRTYPAGSRNPETWR